MPLLLTWLISLVLSRISPARCLPSALFEGCLKSFIMMHCCRLYNAPSQCNTIQKLISQPGADKTNTLQANYWQVRQRYRCEAVMNYLYKLWPRYKLFRCASISWFEVVSGWVIAVFFQIINDVLMYNVLLTEGTNSSKCFVSLGYLWLDKFIWGCTSVPFIMIIYKNDSHNCFTLMYAKKTDNVTCVIWFTIDWQ